MTVVSSEVRRVAFANGITLISQFLPYALTASVGVWIGSGSRNEAPDEAGAHHFLEHLGFCGTAERDTRAIHAAMDQVGGRFNAFTTRDATCYYTDLLPDELSPALSLLLEMVRIPSLEPTAVERERRVILQEIRSAADNPTDAARELCLSTCWANHPLGQPILGTPDSVSTLTAEQLRSLHAEQYVQGKIVVAVAGQFDQEALEQLIARSASFPPAPAQAQEQEASAPHFKPGGRLRNRPLEHLHLCVGLPAAPAESPDLPMTNLLAGMLAGGPGSRLFEELRSKRGWAYRVEGGTVVSRGAGVMLFYLAVEPENAAAGLEILRHQVGRVAAGDFTPAEYALARRRLVRSLILGQESPRSHMLRLGRMGLNLGRAEPAAEIVAHLEGIGHAECQVLAASLIQPERIALGAAGPVSPEAADRLGPGLVIV